MKAISGFGVALAVIVALAFCGCAPRSTTAPSGVPSAEKVNPPAAPSAPTALTGKALGEQIFVKGTGADGKHIATEKGSTHFKSNPGGCANCHGEDAKGKQGQGGGIPSCRYIDLCMPHDGKPAMFTDATLKRAITQGLDEEGKPLEDNMPRWKLSDAEFSALVEYLKTLGETKPAQ